MPWHDESDHPFAGIAEKLKRADENIINLHQEITNFFDKSKYPVVPDQDTEEWQQAIDYHRSLSIPIRFSVLCSEIIHHMRSCLDHIVWHFSSPTYRREHETAISFPVVSIASKDELSRYERQVKGVTNTNVLKHILALQPYHRGDEAINHPLCIVHDMDRFAKHRELAIIASCVNLNIPRDAITAFRALVGDRQGEPLSADELATIERTFQPNMKFTPQVAFVQFGNRKTQPVVPSLKDLQNIIDWAVTMFAKEV